MELTERLATLYARYRQRLINGPPSVFYVADEGEPPVACPHFPDVPFQQVGDPVQFLRQATTDPAHPGAFLIADQLTVVRRETDPSDLPEEERPVVGIRHADQTLYASNLFLALIAEYAITYDEETLRLAESVLAMLQRLGTWQPGYDEEASDRCRPRARVYGYMLRHDAFDGQEESFCDWKDDPFREDHRFLEPSYDQLGSLNNCCAFAYKILTEPDVKLDPDCPASHHGRIDGLKTNIIERMVSTHNYIARNCRYFLRRCDGIAVDRGGGACWMFAYPLARTQAWVRESGPDSYLRYDPYLETFLWRFLPELIENFVNMILDGLIDELPGFIASVFDLNNKIQEELGRFGEFLDIVLEYFGDILEDIFVGALETLRELVRGIISSVVGDFLRDQLANFPDTPISRGLNEALAVSLFRIFSRATIVDPRRELDPRDSLAMSLVAGQFLPGLPLPDAIQFRYERELKTPAVTARDPVFGNEVVIIPAQDFGTLDYSASIDVNWASLFDALLIRFTVPIAILGEIAFSNSNAGRFMSYHFFTANAAAHSFDVTQVDAIEAANRFDNAFFMALLHRFHGADGPSVRQRLSSLESAPDNFPKASAPRGWNQDFRWKREKRDPGGAGTLYNGVDFMVAAMVAGAHDASINRGRLIDAIEAERRAAAGDEEPPGVLRLPFEGPFTPSGDGWTIWNGAAAGITQDEPLFLGVTFERRRPDGGISLLATFDDGTTQEHTFSQGEQARAVQFPPGLSSITVNRIEPGTSGFVLIGLR